VTAEAALGISSVVLVALLVVQSLSVGMRYVRLISLSHSASYIAAASGNPFLRLQQAREFVQEQDSEIDFTSSIDSDHVAVTLTDRHPAIGVWRPHLRVTSNSTYLDEVVIE
jgi:hypothetical protein